MQTHYDIAIIGGGINGAGLAFLAAKAGLKVILFEKADFASGTSSKSSKLIHGGIRYLEQYKFSLVYEAFQQQKELLKLAPHLVRPLPFLIPTFKGDSRPPWLLRLGLWIYDLLSGHRAISPHEWYSKTTISHKVSEICSDQMLGCGIYYDAQTNDARLVLENILGAVENGATCLNDTKVIKIEKFENELQVVFEDERHKISQIKTRCLVNASGPWANEVSEIIQNHSLSKPLIRPTRGTHIVIPQILSKYAVLITSQNNKRVIFVIPWQGYSLIGTTDIDYKGNPDQVVPTQEEIDYLLMEARRVFPKINLSKDQVIAAFAGLRPLLFAEGLESSLSREEKIIMENNIFTIVGGKLTTYRAMAQKTLDKILSYLNSPLHPEVLNPLPGTPKEEWKEFLNTAIPNWIKKYNITKDQALVFASLYGKRAEGMLNLTHEDPSLLDRLDPNWHEIMAQVVFAIKEEYAKHLEDVLIRRMEIGYSPYRMSAVEKVSKLMAKLLHWDENQRKIEIHAYLNHLFPKKSLATLEF